MKYSFFHQKHELLPLEKEVLPYDQDLKGMGVEKVREWADRVLVQIKEVCDINETEFTFLADENYRKYLLPHMKHCDTPLDGLGIGE